MAPTPKTSIPVAPQPNTPYAAQLEAIDDLFKHLRMPHAREVAATVIKTAATQDWATTETLATLLRREVDGRAASMAATRRRKAKLPTGKTFDTWNPVESTIPVTTQQFLRSLTWVDQGENVALCGPSGTGKSFLLEALASAVLDAGKTVAWHTLETLAALVRAHTIDHSIGKVIAALVRHDLIVIDDIGLLPVNDIAAQAFYRVVDAAYERTSIAVSSNLHPSGFDQFMPPTLATATIDRLLHHAHVIQTSGDSIRLQQALRGDGVIKPH